MSHSIGIYASCCAVPCTWTQSYQFLSISSALQLHSINYCVIIAIIIVTENTSDDWRSHVSRTCTPQQSPIWLSVRKTDNHHHHHHHNTLQQSIPLLIFLCFRDSCCPFLGFGNLLGDHIFHIYRTFFLHLTTHKNNGTNIPIYISVFRSFRWMSLIATEFHFVRAPKEHHEWWTI